jgi:hypothetical protein
MKNVQAFLRSTAGAAAAIAALGACDATTPQNPTPATQTAQAGAPGAPLTRESLLAMIEEPDEFVRARKLGELLPTLGPESVPVVKEALDDAGVLELSAIEFELLLHYWAKHAPADAALYALGSSPRAYRVAAIYGAVTPYVKLNPQEALPMVRVFAIDPGDSGAAAQNAIVRGWYESGQPGLEQYIHDLGAGFERQRALSAYGNAMIRAKGSAALVQWAEAVPEDDAGYKLDVFRRTALVLVPHDLEAAKRFCDAHCEGKHGANMRIRIADRWSRDDPRAALEWLAGAPEAQDTTLATRISFANWGAVDRPAALAWMKQQIEQHAGNEHPPEWLEGALPIYARLLGRDEPAEGLVVAERLKDPQDRRVLMVELAHYWYHEKDKAAAEAWLKKSSLPEDLRAQVRSPETPHVPVPNAS